MKFYEYTNSECLECRLLARSPYSTALMSSWDKHMSTDHIDEISCRLCGKWVEDTTIDEHYRAHDPSVIGNQRP